MAARSGFFYLAWLFLNSSPAAGGGSGAGSGSPCDQHHRYRLGDSDPGSNWGPGIVFFGAAAIVIGVVYSLPVLCAGRALCARDPSQVEQEACQDAADIRPVSFGPASSQPRCPSERLHCPEAQHTYVQQLLCLEKMLEGLLNDVRCRKNAMGRALGEDVDHPHLDHPTSDKLTITVHEISDREGR